MKHADVAVNRARSSSSVFSVPCQRCWLALEEVNLMQWTTTGTNHWQAIAPTAVKRIWGSMLNNSPKAWIRVGTSVYQQYLGSQTWVQVRDRITTFEHSSADITVNGAVYGFLFPPFFACLLP